MSRINAAVSPVEQAVLARSLTGKVSLRAVNDNHDCIGGDELLRETLRHFAQFGLGAADKARDNAKAAFFAGDRETYRRWLAICRALDQRMASAVAFHLDKDARASG